VSCLRAIPIVTYHKTTRRASRLNLSRLLIKLERWEEAIAPLQKAMSLYSENSQCYSYLIKVLLKADSEELLITRYLRDLELEEAEVYYGLGEGLVKRSQLEEAISCYHQALA